MNDRRTHAEAWLAKAVSDLTSAKRLAEGEGPYDGACFHAQQAVEKALKAVLAAADAPIPRTHNLEDLMALVALTDPASALATSREEVTDLTPFAVELRYDIEFWPEQSAAREAVAKADRLVALAAALVVPRPEEPLET
jgi:HEPN domain-containing protein